MCAMCGVSGLVAGRCGSAASLSAAALAGAVSSASADAAHDWTVDRRANLQACCGRSAHICASCPLLHCHSSSASESPSFSLSIHSHEQHIAAVATVIGGQPQPQGAAECESESGAGVSASAILAAHSRLAGVALCWLRAVVIARTEIACHLLPAPVSCERIRCALRLGLRRHARRQSAVVAFVRCSGLRRQPSARQGQRAAECGGAGTQRER